MTIVSFLHTIVTREDPYAHAAMCPAAASYKPLEGEKFTLELILNTCCFILGHLM